MNIEPGISDDYVPMDAKRLLERMHTALNSRDVENLRLCFQPDYEQIEPARPGSEQTGAERMTEAWRQLFEKYPKFTAELMHATIDADLIWSEWHWHDGEEGKQGLNRIGVILFGVEDRLIAWSRVYMLPIQAG